MNENTFPAGVGLIGGLMVSLLGGFDYLLKAMLLLMAIDVVSGFVCAWVFNTSQYSNNGVSSMALFQGALRKIFTLTIVCIAVLIDQILDINYARNAAVIYFIATEGISILEHMLVMGVPVPTFITRMLETMKEETENADPDFDQERLLPGKREDNPAGGHDSLDRSE